MIKKIEFSIKPDGTIAEKVLNGEGSSCSTDTAILESALGEVVSRELLPEYYENLDNIETTSQTAY